MKKIKVIILLGMMFLLFVNANMGKDKRKVNLNETPLVLSVSVDSMEYLFSGTIQASFVTATLYNPTRDTIWYVTMSCSYEVFYTTNSDKFKVQPIIGCKKNIYTPWALPPKSRTHRLLAIEPINKNIELKNSKIKIGMKFIKPCSYMKIDSLLENYSKANIIWSNEIDLEKFNK